MITTDLFTKAWDEASEEDARKRREANKPVDEIEQLVDRIEKKLLKDAKNEQEDLQTLKQLAIDYFKKQKEMEKNRDLYKRQCEEYKVDLKNVLNREEHRTVFIERLVRAATKREIQVDCPHTDTY